MTREAAPGSVAQGSGLQNSATAPTGTAAATPASTAAAGGAAPPPLSGQYVLQQQLLQQGGAATAGAFGQQAFGGYPGYPPPQFGGGPTPHHQYGYHQQQALPAHGHGPQPPYGAMPPGYPQYPFHGGSALTTHPGQYPPPPGPYPTQQQQQQQQPTASMQEQQAKPSGAPEAKPDGFETKNDGSGAKAPSVDGSNTNGTAPALLKPLSSAVPGPHTSAIAAAAQGSPENKEGGLVNKVEPMRQDFHFYALDMKDSLMAQAKETVKHAVANTKTARQVKEDDPYLVMTNLNERLIASWQVEPQSVRLQYLAKEEADRKRFQLDDEVASRHCATLTARSKSPKASRKGYGFTPPESYAPMQSAPMQSAPMQSAPMQSGGDVSKKRPAPPSDERSAVKSGDIGEKKSRGDDTVEEASSTDKKTDDKKSATANAESKKVGSDDKNDAKASADSESKKVEDEDESDDKASDDNEAKKVGGDGDIDAKESAGSEAKKVVDDDKSDDNPSGNDKVRKVNSDGNSDAKVSADSEAKKGEVGESRKAESDSKASGDDEAKKGEISTNVHL